LRDVYLKAMPGIVVNGANKNHAKLDELEEQNRKLQEQIGMLWQTLDSTMKALEEKDEKRKAKMDEIRKVIMRERARRPKLANSVSESR